MKCRFNSGSHISFCLPIGHYLTNIYLILPPPKNDCPAPERDPAPGARGAGQSLFFKVP